MSFVLGALGASASMLYPLPAVYVTPSAVVTSPKRRSPSPVVVAVPLLTVVPVPCPKVVTSSEFAVATPEYSRMANRKVLFEMDCETVTVFAPPAMFSA
jgi:hypothetical protein